ncbi:hypothetical protein [Escherichia coli]|uniref:hypothetical protein n=1 Tax=Escherichia coli TaxID=562 RepID=UPI0017C65F46|nr:hypothetical protein [Escherichia coli]EFM6597685.1 hypothetical protein [Escherichia coli]HAW0749688.1 hypothetical protein [Escherichia coli]
MLYGVYGVSIQSCWWYLHYMQGLSGFCVFMGAYYSTAIQIFVYDDFSFSVRIYLYGGCFFQQYFTAQSNQQTGALVLCGCFSRSAVCGYVTGTGVAVVSAGTGRSAVRYPVPFLLSGRSDTERYSGRETG